MRLLYNCLIAGTSLLTATHGLRAQDTITVPCNGSSVGQVYCYVNNDEHSWYWHSECPGEPIILQVTSGAIEGSQYDLLTVYDGANQNAPVLYANPYGTVFQELAGLELWNTGTDMFMTFTSNATNCCATGGLLGGGLTEWVFSASNGSSTNGIPEEQEGNFTMYPNPATDELHLRLSGNANGNAEIRILDVTGRVGYQNNFTATGAELTTFDLRGLQSGIYSVVLTTTTGTKTQQLQVIR